MKNMSKLVDNCWKGLTLQHVSEKKIIVPYTIFTVLALVFELFLLGLVIYSIVLFQLFNYQADFLFYVAIAILLLLFCLTVPILLAVMKSLADKKVDKIEASQ
ncbi:hypothetical protein OEV98_05610 [Caldibacillus lycopersici]|uniref:Uncharacterized protein n=1 Tax=Perspicuibacillus lycopersici TaxID=1325689 RepID=A0AAE3IR31_9BACI|nr:hypothetical protein [Perspicuibacillus lycopersici]MCU9613025.1 hypothetical protein [Perspicuibacillus lycopersici]